MTRNRSFKQLVRARMAKTGESYTSARAVLLAGHDTDPPIDGSTTAASSSTSGAAGGPVLVTSDRTIRARTGRGWEEWFDALDDAGMADRPHREIARWVARLQGVDPLAWNAQAITVSYERARGGREVGRRADGFAVTASRTVAVPAEALFDAVVDDVLRGRWLAGAPVRLRTATRPRSARFDWADDGTRVHVTVEAKGPAASTITVEHARLPDQTAATDRKALWRDQLLRLKAHLESLPEPSPESAPERSPRSPARHVPVAPTGVARGGDDDA